MKNKVHKFANDVSTFVNCIPSECIEELTTSINISSRIFLIGNGGSAAICDHIANDLFKRCNIQTEVLSSYPMITCLANDFGFENVYVRWLQIKRFGVMPGDLLIALSSSGKSRNITIPLEWASYLENAECWGIAGFSGFKDIIIKNPNHNLHFGSTNYGLIEMATEVLLHGIVEMLVKNR